MHNIRFIKTRNGFTLVEVALAVAVGLIIIGGAVLGYNAVKDNASNSNARRRVLSAVTMIEEFSAANSGQYPASVALGGAFSTMWQAKRPDDKALSPWGGTTGNVTTGVAESAPVDFGGTAVATTQTALVQNAFATAPTLAANMLYVTPSVAANRFAGVTSQSTSSVISIKNYAVGIADKAGTPWWDAKGGK